MPGLRHDGSAKEHHRSTCGVCGVCARHVLGLLAGPRLASSCVDGQPRLRASAGGGLGGECCWRRTAACCQPRARCPGDAGLEPAVSAAACTTLLLDLRLPALVLLLPMCRPGVDADTRVADEAREASDAPPAPPADGACAMSFTQLGP